MYGMTWNLDNSVGRRTQEAEPVYKHCTDCKTVTKFRGTQVVNL
jgi:hypothetical protein